MPKKESKYFINWRCSCGHARVKANQMTMLAKGVWYRHQCTAKRQSLVCTKCGESVTVRPAIVWK